MNWKRRLRSEGILIHESMERLTNTRYADDILLYGKSLEEIFDMTEILIEELDKVGLRLHPGKCKILHTHLDEDGEKDFVDIAGDFIKILHDGDSHRYLGRLL